MAGDGVIQLRASATTPEYFYEQGYRAGLAAAENVCNTAIFRAKMCEAERTQDGNPVYDQNKALLGIQVIEEISAIIHGLSRAAPQHPPSSEHSTSPAEP